MCSNSHGVDPSGYRRLKCVSRVANDVNQTYPLREGFFSFSLFTGITPAILAGNRSVTPQSPTAENFEILGRAIGGYRFVFCQKTEKRATNLCSGAGTIRPSVFVSAGSSPPAYHGNWAPGDSMAATVRPSRQKDFSRSFRRRRLYHCDCAPYKQNRAKVRGKNVK